MKNLNKIILEAGRFKNMPKGRRKELQGDADNLPDREPMRRRDCGYLSQGDNLAPLRRWLASQCGRPWDKVYSDLCKAHRKCTLDRYHAVTQHVTRYVELNPVFIGKTAMDPNCASGTYFPVRWFYRDAHGILRDNSRAYRKWGARGAANVDPYIIGKGDTAIYVTEDGRQFRCRGGDCLGDNPAWLVRDRIGEPFRLVRSSVAPPSVNYWGVTRVSGPFVAVYNKSVA